MVSALAARRLTTLTGGDPEESYLAGLLHDIGKLLALRALDHIAARQPDVDVTPTILQEVLEADHAEFGHRVLREWRFPELICVAVQMHEDKSGQVKDSLILRVQAADAIACKMGAHPEPDPDLVLEEVLAIERLGLTDLELAAMMVDLEDEIAALRRML